MLFGIAFVIYLVLIWVGLQAHIKQRYAVSILIAGTVLFGFNIMHESQKVLPEPQTFEVVYTPVCALEVAHPGAHAPQKYFFFNDKYNVSLGEITPDGLRQQYILGSLLRNRYIDSNSMLGDSYTPGSVFVLEDNTERSQLSGRAQISAFYPEYTGQTMNQQLEYKAVPPNTEFDSSLYVYNLHVVSGNNSLYALQNGFAVIDQNTFIYDDTEDPIFYYFSAYDSSVCPIVEKILDDIENSNSYIKTVGNWKTNLWPYLTQYIKSNSDLDLTYSNFSLDSLYYIYEAYTINKFFDTENILFNTTLVNTLLSASNYYIYQYIYGDDFVVNASVSSILLDLRDHITDVINAQNDIPFSLYLGNNNNIYPFLILFYGRDNYNQLPNVPLPASSNLVFEILEDQLQTYVVMVKLNDNILHIQQCDHIYCTTTEFLEFIDLTVIVDLDTECQATS